MSTSSLQNIHRRRIVLLRASVAFPLAVLMAVASPNAPAFADGGSGGGTGGAGGTDAVFMTGGAGGNATGTGGGGGGGAGSAAGGAGGAGSGTGGAGGAGGAHGSVDCGPMPGCATSHLSLSGGDGHAGNDAVGVLGGGGGGGAGGYAYVTNIAVDLSGAGTVQGGDGGHGGAGLAGIGSGGQGGSGGTSMYAGPGVTLTINVTAILGGTGGQGGSGGGNGGDGGNGLVASGGSSVINAATITGGNGGQSGTGAGGRGGAGGAGVVVAGTASFTNSTNIIGGNGADGAIPGFGGAGIVAGNGATILLNGGTISGGLDFSGGRANAITFTGGTNTMSVQPGASFVGNIDVTGTLKFDQSTDYTLATAITGSGSLQKTGTGTLTLNAANSYAGGTTISAGTLQIGDGGSVVGDILDNGALVFNRSNTITFGGIISGSGSLTKMGTGTLILTADNNYAGITTISAGTLQLGAHAAGGLVAGDIVNNGILILNRTDGVALASAISGSGTVQVKSGIVLFAGANSYTGGTVIAGLSTQLHGSATSLQGNISVGAGAVLEFDQASDGIYAGQLSGSGLMLKGGAETLTLTGDSMAFTGVARAAQGVMRVDGQLGGTAEVNNGATLSGTGAIAGAVTVDGTLAAGGVAPGTLTLGALTLNGSAVSSFRLSAPGVNGGPDNDLVNVTGNLALGGTLNTQVAAAGYYRLFNYGSALSGSYATTNVTGFGAFAPVSGQVQTAIPGQVNLSVLAAGQSMQFWDGADMAGDGAVNGGAGTWNAANANWTGQPGEAAINGPWGGSVGIFAGAAGGAVTVAGTQSFDTLQFSADGYVLSGGALAINPASGTAGTFNVDGGVHVTVASVIQDGGGTALLKTGGGMLILTGANTYTGGTTVNGGTLQIASGGAIGAITVDGGTLNVNGTAGAVMATNGAVLKGNGTVGNTVLASGATIAPGNSIGTLNVAGNISFAAGSTYQVEADAAGHADRINATGKVTINGGAVQVLAAPGAYDTTTTYTIISAASGVTGSFNDVTTDLAFLRPSLSYTDTGVLLTLQQSAVFPSIAGTPNQRASATAIQAGGPGALYTALLNATTPGALAAFDATSGEIHATLLASQSEQARNVRRAVLDRMNSSRDEGAGWSLWGQVSGDWGNIAGDGNTAAASRSGVNITIGADTSLDDHWRGGVEGGYDSDKTLVAARTSSATVTGGHFGAYAYGRYDAIVLRAGGSYGFGNADTLREVSFIGFSDTVTASYDANTAQMFAEAGYEITLDGIVLQPFAGLAWTQARADAFRESGGAAALAGAARTMDTGYSLLGLQFAAPSFDFAGGSLAPSFRAAWEHGFTTPVVSRDLSFLTTGQGFTVLGTPLDTDRALIDAGFTLNLEKNTTLSLGYSGALGNRVTDHGVKLMGAVKF